MARLMEYTINSTRFGVRTQIGRYNIAVNWAAWGEAEECQVVGETGSLIAPELLIKWLETPGDGSLAAAMSPAPQVLSLDDLEILGVAY